jgi:hypothetical protein
MFEFTQQAQHLDPRSDVLGAFADGAETRGQGVQHSIESCVLSI